MFGAKRAKRAVKAGRCALFIQSVQGRPLGGGEIRAALSHVRGCGFQASAGCVCGEVIWTSLERWVGDRVGKEVREGVRSR